MATLHRWDKNLQSVGWSSGSEPFQGVWKRHHLSSLSQETMLYLFDSLEVNVLCSTPIECDSFVYMMLMFLANSSLDILGKEK